MNNAVALKEIQAVLATLTNELTAAYDIRKALPVFAAIAELSNVAERLYTALTEGA